MVNRLLRGCLETFVDLRLTDLGLGGNRMSGQGLSRVDVWIGIVTLGNC